MRILNFDKLDETIYYEQLNNGLKVIILHKENFQKTYATFTTKYGSIDNSFGVDGKEYNVPDGIAHFLEHKMFEQEEGDVFQNFAKFGAQTNAFTSFNRTTYLFSSTDNIPIILETLLDFVQSPYFTEENVEKEKGIIAQEIKMYEDNPDWKLYFGLIGIMYKGQSVSIDIAGTVDSISKITKEDLYTCYNTFYHPSNMVLFVASGVNPKELLEIVRNNQIKKSFSSIPNITRKFPKETASSNNNCLVELRLAVAIPKLLVGFRDNEIGISGEEFIKQELTTQILLEMLFGQSTILYEELINEGLIDDSFSYDYQIENQYGFSTIGGNTRNPKLLLARIETAIERSIRQGLDKDLFERIRKKKIGDFLRKLNYSEFIANQYTRYVFNDANLFDMLTILEKINFSDVTSRMEHLKELSASIINIAE